MTRNAMARRILALACLVLMVGSLNSVYGQETAQEGQEVDLDGGVGSSSNSDNVDSPAGTTATESVGSGSGDEDAVVVDDMYVEAEDIIDVYVEAEDDDDESAGGAGGGGGKGGGVGSGGFFVKKKAKKGNKMCSWSWREKSCQPAALCQYKYQFLDATVSESCRLKDFSVSRKVFETADVKVKPAVALAGAAGLFAADLAAIRYTSLLDKFPLLFNVAQGFVLFVSGDTLFQVLEQGWSKVVGLRFWRMVRSGLIGALNNGLVHYTYYKWIDGRFPYSMFSEKRWGPADGARSKLAIGFTKWAIEWPTMGVYKIASMFILTAAMSGSMKGLLERMQDTFFLTWLRSLQVWPIYDMILYAYVSTAHRPLFNSFMSIAWGGYLSHVSQPNDSSDDATGADGEGGEEVIPAETS